MHAHQGMPGSAQGGTEHSANFTGADNADAEACGFQMIRAHTLKYIRYRKIGVFFSVHQVRRRSWQAWVRNYAEGDV